MSDRNKVIYLVRHGHIDTNGENRYIGWTDPVLSPKGVEQAKALGRFFAQKNLSGVLTSDLNRAVMTAEAIASSGDPTLSLTGTLREINLGQWEEKTFAEVRSEFPEESQNRGRNLFNHRPPGGESFSDLRNRVVPRFFRFLRETRGEAAVVCHIGVIRAILLVLLEAPLSKWFSIEQDYGAYSIVTVRGSTIGITALNRLP